METISNIASTATNTVSNLIYGDQTKNNETAGKEPVSGKEGKGTAAEPFDQGNAPIPLATDDKTTFLDYSKAKDGEDATTSTSQKEFLQLSPDVDTTKSGTQAPTATAAKDETTASGLPIIPLTADTASSGPETSTSTSKNITESTGPTGTTDKVWKDTPLDDISRSGAPGAGPAAPASVTVATPETTDKSTTAATTSTSTSDPISKTTASTSDPVGKTTAPDSVTAASDTYKDPSAKDSSATGGIVGETTHHKSEPTVSSSTSEEKSGKMSHLKEKLKDKLHIGSKDK